MSEKSERLFQAMNDIGSEKIDEAVQHLPAKRKFPWLKWTGLAAAVALAVGIVSGRLPLMGGCSSNSGAGAAGAEEAYTFLSYAGPVFPLTLKEENAAITAVRDITLDFAPWVPVWVSNEEEAAARTDLTQAERQEVLDDYNEWFPEGGYAQSSTDMIVTDSYVLTNDSDTDQTVNVLYPFISSLGGLTQKTPSLTQDGRVLETTVHAGGYVGGFQGVPGIGGTSEEQLNLDPPSSWENYQALLTDGSYLQHALGGYPDFTEIPATVYKFTNAWGPEESDKIPNPSIRVTFDLDYEETKVLSYGFHSMSWDEERAQMGQGFSIRNPGEYGYGTPYYLIVIGDDVRNMEIQGFATGGWDTEEQVEAGVDVERYETDLDSVLKTVTSTMFQSYQQDRAVDDLRMVGVDYEMYYGLFCEYLTAYGVLSDRPTARYDTGWLEDLDFDSVDRVFYLEAEVSVPAGNSVTLAAVQTKGASFDFHCTDTKNQGVYGYDLLTQLGSNLTCAAQTATIEDRGQVEIVRQNFGFDLEGGVKTVPLDAGREHYYLEVRRAENQE
ncbi:MAG: hypothetical protein AB7E30_06090 [Lawsonibacter sp.]